jgi:vancomycin resistance protein YoaR
MNKPLVTISSGMISALLLGSSVFIPSAQAATLDKTTPSTEPPSTVTVPPEMITAWKGLYTVPTSSILRQQSPSIIRLMNAYVGRELKSSANRKRTYYYNPKAVYSWINGMSGTINILAKEPVLEIDNGRAVKFEPPQTGRMLNVYQSSLNVITALEAGKNTAPLAIYTSSPRTDLSELNDLGITELVSRGQSSFKGSPKNRRHNIAVGVAKMKGIIIKPGEEFSFNKYLGPVEASEGFLPELVIKRDKGTVPELGGGLCQVSSTTFRAAMKAGLPITQRRNHSYAVQYYAPQGTDATIYPGVIDLKFLNDTPGSILVWPYFPDQDTLIFDFYGTKDNREVVLKDPVSYDRKSDGSLKANWTRTVIKNGVSDTKTFNSVYLPPALFHKEEQFVANPTSPNPTTPPGENPGTITPTPAPPTNEPTPPATGTQTSI